MSDLLVRHSDALGDQDSYDITVLIVHDVLSAVPSSQAASLVTRVKDLLGHIHEKARIAEFVYSIPQHQFTWSVLAETGGVLLDNWLLKANDLQLAECPLIILSIGLGGIVVKSAVSILYERLYDPSMQTLADALNGLVFLGTPHPSYRKSKSSKKLDTVVLAMGCFPRKNREKIAEEAAIISNISQKFQDSTFPHVVITGYELQSTKVQTGLLRSRKEVIVDQDFAATGSRSELLVPIDADHDSIADMQMGSAVYQEILALAQRVASSNRGRRTSHRDSSQGRGPDVASLWASSKAPSRLAPEPNVGRDNSPMGATNGSTDPGFEIIAGKPGPVSRTMTPRLPCYMLQQRKLAGECFGRSDIVQLLREALLPEFAQSGSSQRAELKSFALYGLGGVGKSEIAIEFAMTYKEKYDAVFWVNADTEPKLASSFNEIAVELSLSEDADAGNQVVSRDRVIEWLTRPSKRPRDSGTEDTHPSVEEYAKWLLIFDNADHPEFLVEYWPVGGGGSVLVTSRNPLTKSHIYIRDGFHLEGLKCTDAAALLRTLTDNDKTSDIAASETLAQRLGGHPLTLTQVAGIINQRDLTIQEFLDLHQWVQVSTASSHGDGAMDEYRRMLLNVWAFEDLEPATLRLLNLLAQMDPDGISESIFEDYTGKSDLSEYPIDKVSLEASRTKLLRSSFIQRDKDNKRITIHRLVQDATRAKMSPETLSSVSSSLTALLTAAWPTSDVPFGHETAKWKACSKVLPHIQRLIDLHKARGFEKEASRSERLAFAKLVLKAGWFHNEKDNFGESVPLLRYAETLCLDDDSESKAVLADVDFCLSYATSWIKDYNAAFFHAERALSYRKQAANDSFALAMAYNRMGYYYGQRDEYEAALEMFRLSIGTYGQLDMYRDGSQKAIFPSINAAFVLCSLGRLQEAEALATDCLAWSEQKWGRMNVNSFKTGYCMQVLGNIRASQGRWSESLKLHQDTLSLYRSAMGAKHRYTANALIKVAQHCLRLGQNVKAEELIDDALDTWSDRPYCLEEKARAYHLRARACWNQKDAFKAKGWTAKATHVYSIIKKNSHVSTSTEDWDGIYEMLVSCFAR